MVQCIYGGRKSVSDAYRAVMRQIGSIALGDGGGGHQQGQGGMGGGFWGMIHIYCQVPT